MSDFHLPRRYDAVLCLFSSIGYLRTLDRVEAALACFQEHLAPGGVLIVEPWPDDPADVREAADRHGRDGVKPADRSGDAFQRGGTSDR